MTTTQLALYKAKGQIGNAAIRLWTGSKYSHCELVIDDMAFSSSIRDGGVRAKQIDFDPEHWDFVDLPDEFVPRILAHYQATRGASYGWRDLLLSQVLNMGKDEDGAAFCSEWCAAAIGLPTPTIYSPKTLGELVPVILAPHWRESAK